MKTNLTAEVLLNSFVLALLSSLVRVLFSKSNTFRETITTFVGGIVFGVLAGYLANDIKVLDGWVKMVIVGFSLVGKELFEWLKSVASNPLRTFKQYKGEVPIEPLTPSKNDS